MYQFGGQLDERQLNAAKWCVPPGLRHQLPADQLTVGPVVVASVDSVVSSCFGVLRQIRCIRRYLPHEALAMLVTSFITSKSRLMQCRFRLTGALRT